MFRSLKRLFRKKLSARHCYGNVREIRDLILHEHTLKLQSNHSNPLNKFGKKCFSQTDEDGITLEIVRRLNIKNGLFAEFGVGSGLENNTLILAALGWQGFWVGGENLAFNYTPSKKFIYIKDWITLDNVTKHAKCGASHFNNKEIDVISLDLDGNDIYFVENLLKNKFSPKLFIVEYNAKFLPPIQFQIEYDAKFQWQGDDYFGASLTSFVKMFSEFEYTLVCCNAHSGANAFFIRNEFIKEFSDIPTHINDLYMSPRYYTYINYGHKISSKVVETIFKE